MAAAVVNSGAVTRFLLCGLPKERLVYATGVSLPAAAPRSLADIRLAYNDGRVDLSQRRNPATGGFDYIATIRRRHARVADNGKFEAIHLHYPDKKDAA